jgi:hypothetical protein
MSDPKKPELKAVPDPEVSDRPRRRTFTAEYKLSVLSELDACTEQGVAGWLGFDASRTVVRTLRKLTPEQCSPWSLALMQRALGQFDTHKLLCHLPWLNGPMFLLLELLLDPGVTVVDANALALELAALEREQARVAKSALRETCCAWATAFPGKPMPSLPSLAQLEQLHLDASAQLGAPLYHWGGKRQLLPPSAGRGTRSSALVLGRYPLGAGPAAVRDVVCGAGSHAGAGWRARVRRHAVLIECRACRWFLALMPMLQPPSTSACASKRPIDVSDTPRSRDTWA